MALPATRSLFTCTSVQHTTRPGASYLERSSPSLRGSDNRVTGVPHMSAGQPQASQIQTVGLAYRVRSPPGITGVMHEKPPQASPPILDGAGLQNAACKTHASPIPTFPGI